MVQGENMRLGTLFLASNMQAINDRLTRYAWLAAAVMIVSLAVAYLMSTILQKQISRPVLAMAETARAISQRGDYSVRATKHGQDEIGLLTDAFNLMLGQIEAKDRTIRDNHERLNLALEASGVGTWNLDVGENRISLDKFANPLFGYPTGPFDAAFDLFLTMIHRDDRAARRAGDASRRQGARRLRVQLSRELARWLAAFLVRARQRDPRSATTSSRG